MGFPKKINILGFRHPLLTVNGCGKVKDMVFQLFGVVEVGPNSIKGKGVTITLTYTQLVELSDSIKNKLDELGGT